MPFVAWVVFQEIEYGAVKSSTFKLTPSNLNCTPATPTLSDAVAETVVALPETVAPPDGAVIEIVGLVVSAVAPTVTVTDLEVVPPVPVQAKVYVLLLVKAPVDCEPEIVFEPLQAPEAVQLVALEELQLSVDEPPEEIEVGEAVKVTVGAGVPL